MGVHYSVKSRPSQKRSPRNRQNRQQQLLSDIGSTTGVPLFLQRTIMADSEPKQEEALSNSASGSILESANQTIIQPLPNLEGEGEPSITVAYGNSLRLQGLTRARFSNSFATQDVVTAQAEGCEGCRTSNCVHVTGTLISAFTVTTTVTLPSVTDFPTLTDCQQQRVQNAINTVLAPHEQQHVSAFNTYNGSVSTVFDMTFCRGRFANEIQALHNRTESSRRRTTQAASDALDPFHFDIDLDCTD
ncbi:MAG: hypothetical protein DCF15_20185 [Phormidesmis priestleyi]|uniref:Uncharacterized protein n=1 Tax=Phormidesmis priestleyi TaxID=268141 RepID=A0A2W4WQC4_9CYAN|nr:MAG: hypothetical protein DCF15_20185 [Phormidesmis priestleyi]